MHPGIPHRNNLTETLMMKESKTSRTNSSPVEAVGNQEPVIIFCNISALLFLCMLQLQWVTWHNENKWASGCFSVQKSQILGQRDIHEIAAHNSTTGANKTQTKQSKHLWRAACSGCHSSFQQYTECSILSTSMLFGAFLQIFGEKEGRWNRERTMGLWLCYGVRATRPASPL